MAHFTYSVYGMQIASAMALLLPSPSFEGREPDVLIRPGDVPAGLKEPEVTTPVIQARPDTFLFSLPGVGRFLVLKGQEVVWQTEAGVPEEVMSLHLSHAALGALLYQRGLLPLHASGVIVDGGCVSFLGGPAAGKSTLAAALWQRGYQVLCDDICAVTFTEGIATVQPGIRQLQLWQDAAQALGLNTASAPRTHPEGARYGFTDDGSLSAHPFSLRRLYVLREARVEPEGIRRLKGSEAFMRLVSYTYCPAYLVALGGGSNYFGTYAGIARSVPLFLWSRPPDLERLDDMVDLLEGHLKDESA